MTTDEILLSEIISELNSSTRLQEMDLYPQHGSTSCLLHCIGVSYTCIRLSKLFRTGNLKLRQMLRAAMLHDYFLYDWHDASSHELPHAGNHASVSLKNALQDLELTDLEQNMIKSHMFPIRPRQYPRYKESVILILSDKICALHETLHRADCYRGGKIESIVNNSTVTISNWQKRKR